jgi:ubiquinone/menaquinone biosynthesis C-methylase UbiE
MVDRHTTNVQSSYDRVADEYAQRIYDELRHKPLDRELLDRLADQVRGRGTVCDLGCGPGHIARYLHERGVPVVGVDLSPEMIAQARRLNPEITFIEGNMLALEAPDRAWAGIAAFYSIIHIPRADVVRALREMKRVLQPGGVLLLAFHIGDETIHKDEWWGQQVCIDFFFFQTREMLASLNAAGLAVVQVIERDPYPGVEHQSRRAYIFARNGEAESTPVRTDL